LYVKSWQIFLAMLNLKSKPSLSVIMLCLMPGIIAFQCEKEPAEDWNNHSNNEMKSVNDSVAIRELSRYYYLLETLKKEGYTFYDFNTFIHTDTSRLPAKLFVIRHDIHSRDIKYAYDTYEVEKKVIGPGHSTFFILLDDPVELATEGKSIENNYMKFFHIMDSCHVDIEPHISPIDMYIASKHPFWENYPVDSLKNLFNRNYEWEIGKTGRSIRIKNKDVFHIMNIDRSLISLLWNYNKEWTKLTGLAVEGYSAHGSGTAMNKVLNNAYLLDQDLLLHTGIYQYDAYNTKIFKTLNYLSDNVLPAWMDDPASIKPGRYEFLMHPYQWRPQGKSGKSSSMLASHINQLYRTGI
jgi:hypothetical protein